MKAIRIGIILLSIIFIGLVSSAPVHAAEDMMDNLLPQEDEEKTYEGNVKLEYKKYPLSRYGMDTQLEQEEFSDLMPWGWDDNVGKQINQGLSIMASTLWGFNKIIAATVGTLVSEAFNLDIVGDFADEIATAVKSIAGFGPGGFQENGLWPYLVMSVVCIVGVWGAYVGVIKRASSRAMGGVLSSIIIMTVALGFFTNAEKILNGINDGVSEVQNDVLSFSISATIPGKYNEAEGIASMRNQIFNLMVTYPYMLLNFGTTDEEKIGDKKDGGSRVDAVLKTKTLSKKRIEAIDYEVKEMKNNNMKPESLTDRLVILILVLIANSILGIMLLLISGSLIVFQILVLVFSVFTPVAFLIGLIPAFSHTATSIIMKLLHAFYMKIALALLATIYFTISTMVYNTADTKQGYILLFLLQIICAIAVWVKRNEILNVVTMPFRKSNVSNNIGQSIKDYKKTYFKGKKYFNKFTKPQTTTLAERTGYNKLVTKPGVGVVDPMRHPAWTGKERRNGSTVTPAPAANSETTKPIVKSNQKTAAPVERKQQHTQAPVTATPSSPVTAPVASSPIVKPNVNNHEPTINERRNLESLEATLNKGSWSHHTKESAVTLKGSNNIKERLAERTAATQTNPKQNLRPRLAERRNGKDDKNES